MLFLWSALGAVVVPLLANPHRLPEVLLAPNASEVVCEQGCQIANFVA